MDIQDFEFTGKDKFSIKKAKTSIPDIYKDKADYEARLTGYHAEIDALQTMMYAHNRYSMLVIFQAIDAAGKDSTIKNVFSGVNPQGVHVSAFKRPSDTELDHDYMWRTTKCLPERGQIGVFNRSYYEEVLIVKVHPEMLTNYQKIPMEFRENMDMLWENRYQDISNFEHFLHRNGTRIVKIFLNISKEEQAERFLSRLEDLSKNWKFSAADLKEREHWDAYMQAYQDAINATASKDTPWYVVPGNDKKNARLIIAEIILKNLKEMDMAFPTLDVTQKTEIEKYKEQLKKELKK